jgi:hypothetical protein
VLQFTSIRVMGCATGKSARHLRFGREHKPNTTGESMSLSLDKQLAATGTRFRLFAQARYLKSFSQPETVIVSLPPAQIQPGPADARMFVVNAKNKKPYRDEGKPQFKGEVVAPVQPNAEGHFDHLDVDSQAFSCATMYATVRRVLDIWEDYFGHQIPWWFEERFERLELIPLVHYDNAGSGFGYLEFGFGRLANGTLDPRAPFCENFDVLAHELGHSIIFGIVGAPRDGHETLAYGGFQESSGDLTAIVAVLHFHSVVDHLLAHSRGNLFTVNELSRLGELPDGAEIRRVFNDAKLSTVGSEEHDLSLPLTGALFDVFVEVYQRLLVEAQLISPQLAARSSYGATQNVSELAQIDHEFAQAYQGHESAFKDRLFQARDYLGKLLATTWGMLHADDLSYEVVARAVVRADRVLTGGANVQLIRECFAWREIAVAGTHVNTAALERSSKLMQGTYAQRTAAPALADTLLLEAAGE